MSRALPLRRQQHYLRNKARSELKQVAGRLEHVDSHQRFAAYSNTDATFNNLRLHLLREEIFFFTFLWLIMIICSIIETGEGRVDLKR